MAIEVVMPQLGLSMDSGHIIEWLKATGDMIQPGDLLLTVESDKSTVEVEAVESGVLHIVQAADSGDVSVGSIIAYLLAEDEALPGTPDGLLPSSKADGSGHTQPTITVTEPSTEADFEVKNQPANGLDQASPSVKKTNRPPSSPAARRRAAELQMDWRLATGTGPSGRIKERDIETLANQLASSSAEQLTAPSMTPVAARMVQSTGLDPQLVAERFPGQRLGREEVDTYIREALKQGPKVIGSQTLGSLVSTRREKMGRLRTLIAKHMQESSQTKAPVTLTTEADGTELVHLRTTLKLDPLAQTVPSYNALLAKIVARALEEHPQLNASIDDDEIVYWEGVHIGTAVDTERGLVVPVVRDVQNKSVQTIHQEMAALLPRAKAGKAVPDELTGGTFTITNLGPFEIDAFTPIINRGECAILGVGRLIEKYVVISGEPQIRTMMALSLTFDHRLVDGGPAAAFLQRIKHLIEAPYLWLI